MKRGFFCVRRQLVRTYFVEGTRRSGDQIAGYQDGLGKGGFSLPFGRLKSPLPTVILDVVRFACLPQAGAMFYTIFQMYFKSKASLISSISSPSDLRRMATTSNLAFTSSSLFSFKKYNATFESCICFAEFTAN